MRSAVPQFEQEDRRRETERHRVREDHRPRFDRNAVSEPEGDSDGEDDVHAAGDTARVSRANGHDGLWNEGAAGERRCDVTEQFEIHVRIVRARRGNCSMEWWPGLGEA